MKQNVIVSNSNVMSGLRGEQASSKSSFHTSLCNCRKPRKVSLAERLRT